MRSTGDAHDRQRDDHRPAAPKSCAAWRPSKARSRSTAAGRHAFLLDIGRKMGSRYRVDIDGETYVDFTNLWLPPTMSFFADLTPGNASRDGRGERYAMRPSLYYGPVEDTTVWRSPVADAIDYVVIAGPAADDIMATYRDAARRHADAAAVGLWLRPLPRALPLVATRSSRRSTSSAAASCPSM